MGNILGNSIMITFLYNLGSIGKQLHAGITMEDYTTLTNSMKENVTTS